MIETRSLTRRFGAFTAVDAVDLAVAYGEVFGLLGPNGAGKSTTIKLLTTLLPPSAGSASVAGFAIVGQAAEVRRSIGYVPQMLSADGALSGFENLLVSARLYDLSRREAAERARSALAYMGLADVAGQLVRTYSGGMIRRLEIAQALLHGPQVLFLDEPTVGLDPLARRTVWERVRQLRELGITIMLTTHLMDEADILCDQVGIMHHGQLVVTGAPAALKAGLQLPEATLEDVFVHYTGDQLASEGGSYRDTARARRTAQRLG